MDEVGPAIHIRSRGDRCILCEGAVLFPSFGYVLSSLFLDTF